MTEFIPWFYFIIAVFIVSPTLSDKDRKFMFWSFLALAVVSNLLIKVFL